MGRSSAIKFTTITALLLSSVSPIWASSHREAPAITEKPKVDNTDVYAFRSYEPGRAGFVTLITNFQPFQEPGGGPNYYTMDPDAIYEIHIDNNGDAVEDLTFQFKFTNTLRDGKGITLNIGGKELPVSLRNTGQINGDNDPDLAERETYSLTQVTGNRRSGQRVSVASGLPKPVDNIGNKSVPNYPAYASQFVHTVTLPGCATQARVFVGQREEAFAVNLGPLFDLVNLDPINIAQSDANQELIGKKNITSIAMEVPIACLTGTGNGVIGVWSTASLPQARILRPTASYAAPENHGGAFVQVSRLGMPLVNEVVIGLPQKDLFNSAKPTQDSVLADFVTNPTFPAILEKLFGTKAPTNFPRNDLVATFLTGIATLNQLRTVTASEMLRLNTAIAATPQASQSTFGVAGDDLAGFPNGRRPGDDVVDIVLRVAMGRLCHPVPISGKPTDLGLCTPAQAPSGLLAFTDGAPTNATRTMNAFPYLNPALRGAPRPQTQP
ncbi:DUF4331 domain-containing protein [Blastomonas sp.]|uniref:DUF4331 domain-containing protein n=1 Tax=Blastomonas sp. TaxID=1909299 RepID=UPI0035941092